MEIFENRTEWLAQYHNGYLADYDETGQLNWKRYPRPRNRHAVAGPGVELSQSRLMLISSAGGYLPDSQTAFDAAHDLGDYSIRLFPTTTPLSAIDYAHDHYDQTIVRADPQTMLPLRHLETLAAEGVIGELAPSVVSFMGYQPDVARVVDEMIPSILEVAQAEEVHAALLVPA